MSEEDPIAQPVPRKEPTGTRSAHIVMEEEKRKGRGLAKKQWIAHWAHRFSNVDVDFANSLHDTSPIPTVHKLNGDGISAKE